MKNPKIRITDGYDTQKQIEAMILFEDPPPTHMIIQEQAKKLIQAEKLIKARNILEEVADAYRDGDQLQTFLYEAQDYIEKAEAVMRDRCKHGEIKQLSEQQRICMVCGKIYND